jgi:transposase
MRRSFDGLALATRQLLGQDPQSGALFVFVNKRSNRAKVLWFERHGYCLLYKRLHRALFRLPVVDDRLYLETSANLQRATAAASRNR